MIPGRGRGRGRALGTAAIGVGVALLGVAGVLAWQHAKAPPLYQYVMGEVVPAAELGPLAPLAAQQVTVRRATVMSIDHPTPLADLEVAEMPGGPVLLDWQARIDDPFLTITPPSADIAALAAVLARHVDKDTRVLGWWDSSRQLQILSSTNVVFDQHLGTPLFVPARWQSRRSAIGLIEYAFWKSGDVTQETARFQRFADALLANEDEGMAKLQALSGGKRTVLILHLRDVILLGQMAPKKIGVAFQDFGASSDVHGMVSGVHAWLEENKYPAYAVLQGKANEPLRAIALTDAASAKTLAARLLPFMGNDQRDVKGATLVYKVGGFSVYELAPGAAPAPALARAEP